MYILTMKFKTVFIVLLCALCSTTTKSQNVTHNVTGPNYFVTDGTRELTLTCQADTSSGYKLLWSTPGTETRCEVGTPKDVCIFTPRLEDDNQNVSCVVLSNPVSIAVYRVNLKYPPPSVPNITIEPPQTEPLMQGDVITCTVSGGKPPVTNVIFHCQHPDHADREDDVSDDGLTVSSSITVGTSQATEVYMTCTCSSHWDPEPELYDNITNAEFMLEYKSIVTNFTVNGSTIKTASESEMVTFRCQGAGRPSPTLVLRKHGNDTAIRSGSSLDEGLLHHIGSARCKDLGNYTCEANNTFSNPNSETVQLFVKCSTRPADDFVDIANIYNLTQAGLTFTVIGYPTPDIAVTFCGNNTHNECQPVLQESFSTRCERNNTMVHLVYCTITPVSITEDKTGLYNMTMNNAQGNVTVTFQILHAENNIFRNESGQTSQRVTATVQPQVHSQAHHNQMSPVLMADPGYACPADMLPSGSIHAAEASTIKPNPYDPGYASADDIGLSTHAQRVAVSYNPRNNSLKSRSANQHCDIPLQPAEPANKPQDDGVDEYNVLGGQGATSGPDPTYSHINKVNNNQ